MRLSCTPAPRFPSAHELLIARGHLLTRLGLAKRVPHEPWHRYGYP